MRQSALVPHSANKHGEFGTERTASLQLPGVEGRLGAFGITRFVLESWNAVQTINPRQSTMTVSNDMYIRMYVHYYPVNLPRNLFSNYLRSNRPSIPRTYPAFLSS
jgi:hypothetical protein